MLMVMPQVGKFEAGSIQAHCELSYSEPLLELLYIDDTAAVGAITKFSVAVPGLDLEHHAFWIDLDDVRNGPDSAAHRRRREVTDFHLHTGAHKARREM